jgi:hypothetical protein
MPEKSKDPMHICGYCNKAFASKNALSGHLSVCKAKPDETEEEQEEEQEESPTISLFDDDDEPEEKPSAQDKDDDYQCGGCGHTQKRSFKFCPKCGEENDFD